MNYSMKDLYNVAHQTDWPIIGAFFSLSFFEIVTKVDLKQYVGISPVSLILLKG